MSPEALEAGYWRAYRDFYRWRSIWRSASTKTTIPGRLRHLAYAGGWRKCEPLWGLVVRAKGLPLFAPALEGILSGLDRRPLSRRQSPGCRRPGAEPRFGQQTVQAEH